MAKKTPTWQIMGLDGPPPAVAGYHDYGTVYRPEEGPQREPLSHAVRLALWSWAYWGRKVRQGIEDARTRNGKTSVASRALDRFMLALVRLIEHLHRWAG